MTLTKLIKTRFLRLLLCLLAILIFGINGQTVLAYPLSELQTPYYKPGADTCNSGSSADTTTSTAGLDAILQAIAAHESSGNPTVVNSAGAAGKYQFFSKYWQSSAARVYPPGQQYASAEQARNRSKMPLNICASSLSTIK